MIGSDQKGNSMTQEKNAIREALRDLEIIRRKYVQQNVVRLGLTWGQGQARILDRLLDKDHITQKELSDLCSIDVTTMSRALDRLEEAGYLSRKKAPDNRRSYQIALTDAGRAKAQEVRAVFERMDEAVFAAFSSEERKTLLSGIERISQSLCTLCETEPKE